jgi:YesN/AraC family two-component response regulator
MEKRLLIIDPSRNGRTQTIRELARAGLTFEAILEAGNGPEALRLLQEKRVDLMVWENSV